MYTWDPNKSATNKLKHGISFEEARDSVFEGKNILAEGVAYNFGEIRHAIIGKHNGNYYVGIFHFTAQGLIRIISVRRARNEEEKQAKAKGI